MLKKILLPLSLCCLPLTAAAQEKPQAPALPTSGPESLMAMEAGVWDADITFPSNDPSKPDTKAKGVQDNELRSNGMWMLNRFHVEGTPYQGTGVWGYDRVTGRYSGIWADNNDAQIRSDDGRWDSATKTLTWSADQVFPDGRRNRYITTEEFKGDVRIWKVVALTRKGEVPVLHIVFTRRPGSEKEQLAKLAKKPS